MLRNSTFRIYAFCIIVSAVLTSSFSTSTFAGNIKKGNLYQNADATSTALTKTQHLAKYMAGVRWCEERDEEFKKHSTPLVSKLKASFSGFNDVAYTKALSDADEYVAHYRKSATVKKTCKKELNTLNVEAFRESNFFKHAHDYGEDLSSVHLSTLFVAEMKWCIDRDPKFKKAANSLISKLKAKSSKFNSVLNTAKSNTLTPDANEYISYLRKRSNVKRTCERALKNLTPNEVRAGMALPD